MLTLRSIFRDYTGNIVRAASTARARNLHDLLVMSAQSNVPFTWLEQSLIRARVWVYDRICGRQDA